MKLTSLLFLTLIIYASACAQETVYEGSLLRINFNQSVIDTLDRVGYWQSIKTFNSYTVETFKNIFSCRNHLYFIKNISYSGSTASYGPPPSFQTKLIDFYANNEAPLYGAYYPECGTGIYLSDETKILPADSGFIFTNNLARIGYLFSEDSLFPLTNNVGKINAIQIIGRVNDKYLLTIIDTTSYTYNYYLFHFNKNHKIILDKKVYFPGMECTFLPAPIKSQQLNDSLFIISFEWTNYLFIDLLKDSSFIKIDSLEVGSPSNFWTYINDNLYYVNGSNLVKRLFDKNNLAFGEEKTIFNCGGNSNADVYDRYFTALNNDTLYIYSLTGDKFINKLLLNFNPKYINVLVDSPYIYVPMLDKITGVKDTKTFLREFYLSQNYPNPFNPSTTIKYKIPKESNITIKIFDALGREVTTLLNAKRKAGEHNVVWNAKNYASGIYFYQIRAGEFVSTKKMLLLK